MDLTVFPRELLYKDRNKLEEFEILKRGSFNSLVYREIQKLSNMAQEKIYLDKDFLDVFNDAYFICTCYLSKIYIPNTLLSNDTLFTTNNRKGKELDIYKKIVLTIVKLYIRVLSPKTPSLKFINKAFKDISYTIFNFKHLTENVKAFSINEFKPREITKELLSNISWQKITKNFTLNDVHFYVGKIGMSKEEKMMIIESIYKAEYNSDSLYAVPYEVDRYLTDKYREYGGGELNKLFKDELNTPKVFSILTDKLLKYSRKKSDEEFYKTFYALIKVKDIKTDYFKLDFQNLDLINENKSLKLSLSELQEKYHQLELKYESNLAEQSNKEKRKEEIDSLKQKEAEMKARVDAANAKVDELNCLIQDLQNKLGAESIPLAKIVEGIKRKARFAGVAAANNLFEQIDIVLYDVETWRNNRIELMTFFEELAKPTTHVKVEVQPGGIAQITDKDIVNKQQQPDKLIE